MKWRKWNNIIHRDLGYLCFGLTIIYVISGVAVNHIQDWNPTYAIEKSTSRLDLSAINTSDAHLVTQTVLKQIGETAPLKNIYQVDANTLKIFVENNNVTVNFAESRVYQEKSKKRKLLYQVNFLHLNHPKKLWTWFADLYAVALGLLAVTGIFVLRGKKGITGRGLWLVGTGFIIPLVFLWLYT